MRGGSELERRAFLRGLAGVPLLLRGSTWGGALGAADGGQDGALGFGSVPPRADDALHVPEGYVYDVVASWGDALEAGLGPLAPLELSGDEQRRRFGVNCDFNAFFPLDPGGPGARGLLCVNHEFPSGKEMFPGWRVDARTARQAAVEISAVGLSVIEVARDEQGAWELVLPSKYNRRVTAETEMRIAGPCAGHAWLPGGGLARGTLANCSGGKTPWRTVLSGEENFHQYFGWAGAEPAAPSVLQRAYGLGGGWSVFGWEAFHERFDLARHPDEPNLFGWVVELDPFDPAAVPVKRTALGRIKHEGATAVLSRGGRVVVYMGDDEREQHVYKFVSEETFDPARAGRGASGRDLLDHGRLYVARCAADGTGRWLALVPEGPLAGRSQAEILIGTRLCARMLGASPMDRPEGIAVDPLSQHVYVSLTKDGDRRAADPVNPRPKNLHGQILELVEDGGDLAATSFTWSHFLVCGPPGSGASYAGIDPSRVNPVSCPDNLTFDAAGNLWIATDGQGKAQGTNDALYAVATQGDERGLVRRFLTAPAGGEVCGPELAPDGRTLFVNVQHPGAGQGIGGARSSRWPDGGDGPPRSSVIAVRRADGGVIGA